MKAKNLHLQYKPDIDAVMMVDHGAAPKLAFDVHREFLFCVTAWAFGGTVREALRPPNGVARLLRKLRLWVPPETAVREIDTKEGKIRVTVEVLH